MQQTNFDAPSRFKIYGYRSQEAFEWVHKTIPKMTKIQPPSDWVEVIDEHIEN
jgi:hypothetical protein